ncbi:hypothetical protein [Streptomyces minutiscleroticus]|uniref:Secreted protein n=1 Tax=Streptomyces minutiscleroticus TaxID=68238 RepID=A0A918KUD7_9ACTN|nr:hypothetical protein [Streptomyces minutiscleroticus]GGX73916.1 hypothetical protein GCM10010358_30360 [Streptomyces minutiscleroticus]
MLRRITARYSRCLTAAVIAVVALIAAAYAVPAEAVDGPATGRVTGPGSAPGSVVTTTAR